VILLVKIVGEVPPNLVKQVLVPSSFLGMKLVGLRVVGDHLSLVELFLELLRKLMSSLDSCQLCEEIVAHLWPDRRISTGLGNLSKDGDWAMLL
jgi:hypothetical protein